MSSSSARDRANRNNPYWQIFKDLIEERISEGQYNAEYKSDWNPSDDEKTQMSVAAQAICNLREFSDVGYNYYSEWPDDDDDEVFIVQFYWEDFQYT